MPVAYDPSQIPPNERFGVIDIGSNSVRLVVFDQVSRAPHAVFNEKLLCGLGRGMEETGKLDPDGVEMALAGIDRFMGLVSGMGVGAVTAVATAAVRDASDGPRFVEILRERTGLDVRVLSGNEEARMSALGVISGTPEARGVVGDLGGSSLELVQVDGAEVGARETLPVGPLRLMGPDISRDRLVKTIDRHLDRLDWLKQDSQASLFAVGGAWRTLAKAHMEQSRHPLHIIHHYSIAGPEAREFADLIAHQSLASLDKMNAISRRRLETVPLAALVLERVLARLEPKAIVFSAYGLREGLVFDQLSLKDRLADPLLEAASVMARRMGRFADGEALASWTQPFFVGEGEETARLRMATCLLSDIGWAEHPDYRADMAFYRVLRIPFPGLEHAERAFMALAIFVRYGGKPSACPSKIPAMLLPEAARETAHILGLCLRLGHTLTGGALSLLHRSRLKVNGSSIQLVLPPDRAALGGDVVDRRLQSLAKVVKRKAQVVVSEDEAAGKTAS